jgi:hypothetical protein
MFFFSSNNNSMLANTHSRFAHCAIQTLSRYLRNAEKIEPTTLSMTEYAKFVESIQDEVAAFLKGREKGMAQEEQR